MSFIKMFAVNCGKDLTFTIAAPTEKNALDYSKILLSKGLFPNHKEIISISQKNPTNEVDYLSSLHRAIEAIAWTPSEENLQVMRVLYPHLKPVHEKIAAPQYTLHVNDNKEALVFIAEERHMPILAKEGEKPFIHWTYAYSPERVAVRQYMSIESYIYALQATVIAHDKLYEQSKSIITDSDYDKLYSLLVALERDYPYMIHSQSPTQRIVTTSNVVESLEKVRHSRPMISLDKTTTNEGVLKFIQQRKGESILLQNKEDGLTVLGTYNEGVQKDFVSRGNSEIGERIYHSCSQITNLPKNIAFKGLMELRFEVVVPYEEFNRVNKDGKYSNPRNLAAGTIRSLDGSLSKERGLKAIVIEVVSIEGMDFQYDHERLEFVRSLGFEVSSTESFFLPGTDEQKEQTRLLEFINGYNDTVRPTLDHMIDGLVMKFNRLDLRDDLGETAKYPRWAIAYKFSSQDAITTLNDIVIQIGKTGQLTPVALFDMVEIDGVEVRRATLHNFSLLEEKDIRVGDQIQIARANDVIPQVVKSYPELRKGTEMKLEVPSICPECEKPLRKDGEHIYCINSECTPQIVGKFEHYVSRNAMNIDGCGEKTIELLYEKGFVQTFTDIYKLHSKKEALMVLDNFGDKKIEKMFAGIEESKNQPLNRVLYSFSINLIGQTASKAIATVYPTMTALLEEEADTLRMKLMSLNDFGEKMVQSFVDYMTTPKNRQMILDLLMIGLEMKSDYVPPATDTKISGKTFVITGTLSRSRGEFKTQIELFGGKVSGTVSKKTNYLLMGDGASGTSKHKDAITHNVQIINEAEFMALI